MRHPDTRARARPDERGATAVEYALTLALIAILIVGAVASFGTSTNDLFQTACQSMPGNSSC